MESPSKTLAQKLHENDAQVNRQAQSPLFRLSAEIRNKIWKLASTAYVNPDKEESTPSSQHRNKIECVSHFEPEKSRCISLSLLSTCRRVYLETALMPVSLNSIDLWCEKECWGIFARSVWDAAAKDIERALTPFRENSIPVKSTIHIYTTFFFLRLHFEALHDSLSLADPRVLHVTLPLSDALQIPQGFARSPAIYIFRDIAWLPSRLLAGRRVASQFLPLLTALPWNSVLKKYACLQEFVLEIETPFYDEKEVLTLLEKVKTWQANAQTRLKMELSDVEVTLRRVPWPDAFIEEGKRRNLGLNACGIIRPLDELAQGNSPFLLLSQ